MLASESNAIDKLTIREPDDWHLHVRDDDMMALIAHYSARQFARAIIMPNLVPPVTTVAMAEAYRDRILATMPDGHRFTPLMTAYLTDRSTQTKSSAGMRKASLPRVSFTRRVPQPILLLA